MTHRHPSEMTIIDLDGDTLCAQCPSCGHSIYMTERYLARRHPPHTKLVDLIARMYCKGCSHPRGPRVYANGQLIDHPRSGAEGRNAQAKRWAGGKGELRPIH